MTFAQRFREHHVRIQFTASTSVFLLHLTLAVVNQHVVCGLDRNLQSHLKSDISQDLTIDRLPNPLLVNQSINQST